MRRATLLLLAVILILPMLIPVPARTASSTVINAIGLVDYYSKPTFKPGDWVRYHMVGSSKLGAKDDYTIVIAIAGEEEFWGEKCFWLETASVVDSVEIQSVASLVSYSVFNDPQAITDMENYVRKQITSMTNEGVPVQDIVRRPVTTVRGRKTIQGKLDYYIDSLGTEQVEIPSGKYLCQKILFKQAAGATIDAADSSRYDEVRENRTIYRNTQIPITSIVIEEVENIVARKTWIAGESSDAPLNTRDRAFGRAVVEAWGTGRKSKIIDERFQKPFAEQHAEESGKSRPKAGSG
jgi:hypothetical protein